MRVVSALFLGLFVAIASCGNAPDVPSDTNGVSEYTRPVEATEPTSEPVLPSAPLPPMPVPVGLAAPPEASVGYAGGTRFVVFALEGESAFTVLDRGRGETFRVLGAPSGQRAWGGSVFMGMGLAGGAPPWNLDADREGRILVRSLGGVQLVDLGDHGRMLAAWRGVPLSTSLAPDGKTFAVVTSDAVHLVRASDGAVATFKATNGTIPTWGEENAHWVSDGVLTRVNRETLRATVVRAPAPDARFATSTDAAVVAYVSKGSVSVHVAGNMAPILEVASPDETEQLVVERSGTHVAWIERVVDETKFTDVGHLHVIDVAARTHLRFPMTGSGCTNAPETIDAIRDGKVITDPSCAIGCPPVRWTHRSVAYDARTGKIVEDTSTTESASWNEEQAGMLVDVEALAKKAGVPLDGMLNQPRTSGGLSFLVAQPTGLALVESTAGAAPFALEDSKAASVAALSFSSDGTLVAGIVNGRMRAWDATTGHALMR